MSFPNIARQNLKILQSTPKIRNMATNTAAWQPHEKAPRFEVKGAPMWKPSGAEILVRNKALAINPIDGVIQSKAYFPLSYPAILGGDLAGEVAAVGPETKNFKVGDRVLGACMGITTKRNSDNAFQAHSILQSHMASKIPDDMPFENATVIPLGLATAACGLFQEKPFLGLQFPTEPRQKATGKTILIWGGSSSVGANGIQLAVAAGYEVIATASPKNFDLVKKLGASQVFDYNSSTIAQDLIEAFKGKQCAGALDCIGGQAAITCVDVVHKTAGKGYVATTKGGADRLPEGVELGRIFATTCKDNAVGPAVFQDFLPKALAAGTFVPAPAPFVVGNGLESVQAGVDKMNKGVSAQKVVVTLD